MTSISLISFVDLDNAVLLIVLFLSVKNILICICLLKNDHSHLEKKIHLLLQRTISIIKLYVIKFNI